MSLHDVVAQLACPLCGAQVTLADRALRCAAGHSFDVARQGYVNLLPGDASPGTADTAAMVQARTEFLAAGHYAGLAEAIAEVAAAAVPEATPGCVLDVGAGTGYYLAAVLNRLPARSGIAADVSKFAARRAASAHERIGAVVADTWERLPVRDGAAALVLDVFSPRNAAEFRRVLDAAGALLVVTPTERHLRELAGGLAPLTVDDRKAERLDEQLGDLFELETARTYEAVADLSHAELESLVLMGPSARHVEPAVLEAQIATMPEPFPVTVSASIACYRPR